MKKAKEIFVVIIILIYVALIIVFSKDISASVLSAIKKCMTVIIPSLYIFMIISDFIITSNIYVLLAKPFSIISRYIFRIPEQLFPIYLISNIGGYPVGAKLISDLFEENKINYKTAETMMTYCYFSGPAFIIGIVGTNIFSDIKTGVLIFISLLITNIIIAVIMGLNREIPVKSTYTPELNITFNNFIKSVYSGGISLFYICTIIIFFSSIICIVEKCGVISFLAGKINNYTNLEYNDGISIIKTFMEISNISLFDADIKNLPIITALLSFGGLCIILQIKSIAKSLSLYKFIAFRTISVFLSYLICKLICFIAYNFILPVYSPVQLHHSQNSPIMTVFLLIMTILILLKISIEKKEEI